MSVIDWRTKGFFVPGPPISDGDFIAAGHDLFGDAFTYPLMFARQAALDANVATMAAFCARHGLTFAPHIKTHMSPTLVRAQLDAGAWGVTVATANQALAAAAMGAPRILIANQVLDPTALRWAAAHDVTITVDSIEGAEIAAAAVSGQAVIGAAAGGAGGTLPVLVELGHDGGRTGARTLTDLLKVAEVIDARPGLRLAGVTAYEGGLPHADAIAAFLDRLRDAANALATLVDGDIVVSAGGSAWFDVVADRLRGQWIPGRTVIPLLRSGAYVSHDDGFYRERTPFNRLAGEGVLHAALGVWAQVLSTPEPGLALVGMGKRDAPYDEGLPEPQRIRSADGVAREAIGLRVTRMNDHHTYLETRGAHVVPGDLVLFGISHPCTAFDKWRALPVVDHDGRVSGVLRPYL
ncbi:D-serine deaminase-like pyridoxal phosphate-dependent protein [Catenuloplanes nepalensis]|uniref:D-serine deaminase-like pyridoxal phosphate-dependent protein n=1 Tax=Catenuloplanes nepalensis TaxID=587533 RepID=A0ABT9N7E8_9ACTN|nr:alanine racemase [Catenuloplanes nepalensis]MDP9799632.1 D-serine deaminase-like pyridoxal phosphate-dependent protein [Catenuloplanes nepalensis]